MFDGWSLRTIVHDNGERLERWREFRGRSLGSFESRQPVAVTLGTTQEQQAKQLLQWQNQLKDKFNLQELMM